MKKIFNQQKEEEKIIEKEFVNPKNFNKEDSFIIKETNTL